MLPILAHLRRWSAALAIFAVVATLYGFGALGPFEHALMDGRFRLLPRDVSGQLVVVAIDPESLHKLDTWPWPRDYHARLLDRLMAAGAKNVAFDIDFSAASTANADRSFENALARAEGRVMLPVFAQRNRTAGREQTLVYNSFPIAPFRRSVLLGAVNVFPDADGLVQQYAPVMTIDGAPMPSMAALLSGSLPRQSGSFYLDYGIDLSKLTILSYVDVLQGNFDPTAVAGKNVIVGATAVELGDRLAVPLYHTMAGPLLQALAYESLSQGRTLHRSGTLPSLALALLVLILLERQFSTWGWRQGLLALLGTAATTYGIALVVQKIAPLSLDLAPTLAGAAGLYAFGVVRELERQALAAFRYRMSDQHRRAMMQCVLEDSFDGIVIARLDGTIELVNPAAIRLLGHSSETMVGKPIDLFLPDASSRQAAAMASRRDFRGVAERQTPIELALPLPDGTSRTIEYLMSPSHLPGGHRKARAEADRVVFIHSFRDISERKAAETKLRGAMQQALAADHAKSQFLANMSHELRTPLNAIIGFSEVIRDAMLEPVGQRYRDYAGDIAHSAQHLLGIIGDVLDMAKIESGHFDLYEEETILADVLASCLPLVGQFAKKSQVALAIDIPSDLPALWADRLRIKQILLNLLSNAVKFTPRAGNVSLSAELAQDHAVEIRIADTGIGMKPEEIQFALEPFRQIENTFNRQHEGTGLGLPLTRALTELHGGVLTIDSEPGRGTTVCVRLPPERTMRPVAAEAPMAPLVGASAAA
jgi:PAS domain S-box-containing protein